MRWPPGGDVEHSGRRWSGADSRWQWRLCWPQWALTRAALGRDGGAGENQAKVGASGGSNCLADHPADGSQQQQQVERGANPDQSPRRRWPVAATGGGAAAQLLGAEGAGQGVWPWLIAPQAGWWSRWGGGVRTRWGTRWGCGAVRLGAWAGTRSSQATPRDPTCAGIHAPDL